MFVDRWETFIKICADMLFKFQWHVEKQRLNALDLGPGLISVSLLQLIIREAAQRCSSKFDIIRRYKVVNG